jgi:acetyl-CoA C-acetyltransferase
MKQSVIVSATRTPIGSFSGSLASVPAAKLGSVVISEALKRAGLSGEQVDECIMGCVLMCGQGQAPARQAMKFAGLPDSVGAMTIHKVCGSGLKSVMLADQGIKAGDIDVAVAGGMENMSQAPYILSAARTGYRLGNGELTDSMIKDGLWDPYNNFHMGNAAELCAKEKNISREEQDGFAIESYKRSLAAIKDGKFKAEIAPVPVPQRKGDPVMVEEDEEPGKGNIDKLSGLRPAFQKDGTVTAGNASSINDGAAAVVVMSEDKAKELGVKPIAKIVGHATHSQAPEWFTTAPAGAIEKVLGKVGWKVDEVDLFEVNEAFAVVSVAVNKLAGLDSSKVNVRGGAVSLGHPIGASGARILTTLIHALKDTGGKKGIASLCIGGGEAVAMAIEMI